MIRQIAKLKSLSILLLIRYLYCVNYPYLHIWGAISVLCLHKQLFVILLLCLHNPANCNMVITTLKHVSIACYASLYNPHGCTHMYMHAHVIICTPAWGHKTPCMLHTCGVELVADLYCN